MRVYHPAVLLGHRGAGFHRGGPETATPSSSHKRKRSAVTTASATATAARRSSNTATPKHEKHLAAGFLVGDTAVRFRKRLKAGVCRRRGDSPPFPPTSLVRPAPSLPRSPSPVLSSASPCPSKKLPGAVRFLLHTGKKTRWSPRTPAPAENPDACGTKSPHKCTHELSCSYASLIAEQGERQRVSVEHAQGTAMDVDPPEDTALRIPHVRRASSASPGVGTRCRLEPGTYSSHNDEDIDPNPPSHSVNSQYFKRVIMLRKEAYDDLARSTLTYNKSFVHRMRYLESLTWEKQRSIMLASGVQFMGDDGLWMERSIVGGDGDLSGNDPEVEELIAMIGSDSANINDYAELLEFEDGLVKHDAEEAHWVGDLW